MGEKRTPTSVRHVYDDSGEPSGLLLLCPCRHCFHPRWALAVAFRRPLACCPNCAIGGLRPLAPTGPPPTPCPRNAPALPPLTPTDAPPQESVWSFSAHRFALPRIPRTGCPHPPAAPTHDTQATLVLVKRVQCPWIHRHRVFRITSGEPKNPWKGSAEPSPHFVLVKRGCAP